MRLLFLGNHAQHTNINCRGIQSAGGAVAFGADAAKIPYEREFFSCWGLLLASLLIALPVLFTKIQNTVDIEEDLKFSDETYDEVAPVDRPGNIQLKEYSQA